MSDSSERSQHEQQLDAIIAEYYQAAEQGQPLDQAEVLSCHPDFSAELREFFADVKEIEWAAPPLRPAMEDTKPDDSSRSSSLSPGVQVRYVGDYEILEELGSGGMGVVYKARQAKLKKIVALKMIKMGQLASEQEVRRFQAEARAAANLDHPGIVAVHEVGVHHNHHYYAMDYVAGDSLSKLHRDEPVAARRAAELIKQMAEAMHYAHGQGIVHRDLKPANVLLTAGGVPRITDFGLAKRHWSDDDSAGVSMTEPGQILGTAGYMSPEQAAGKTRLVGPSADIYALGAVLYALLTSRAPFVGESQADTILQVIQREPVSPRILNPSIARDLETICLKCLEKESHKRYGTAQLLADDLSRFLDGRPVIARPISHAARGWRWCRRNPALATLGLVLVIASTIGLTVRHNILAERERVQRQNLEQQNLTRAQGLVDALVNADTSRVPELLRDLAEYRRWADPLLRRESAMAKGNSREKLHLALALLPVDELQVPYLRDQLPVVSPSQFPVVRDALLPQREKLVESLWKVALDTNQLIQPRFQAASALATYAPADKRWEKVNQLVAGHLVTRQASDLVAWREALRPAKNQLFKPLGTIYRDMSQREQPRVFAAETLADYAGGQPAVLVDLLADAEPFQYPVIFEKLSAASAIPLAAVELTKQPPEKATEEDKEQLAKRQANAAVALVRLGAAEQAWPLLKHTPDSRARSYFIHWLSPLGGDPKAIIKHLDSEPDVSIRRALLLTLGEFNETQVPLAERQPLAEKLWQLYETEPDAGLHASAEWLLRTWGEGKKLQTVVEKLKANQEQRREPQAGEKRNWYVNSQGQTMLVIEAGEFQMGSPETEPAHEQTEVLHRRKIARRFEMAAHEVTNAQFMVFRKERPEIEKMNLALFLKTADSPQVGMTWYEAAAYCNWLSEKDLLPEDQWCYEPNAEKKYAAGMKAKAKAGELSGYRLPSEAEWEYACRAGAVTSRYYGLSEPLLSKYEWYLGSSKERLWPVGSLKPNDWGLFDMLGNASEWTHEPFSFYPDSSQQTLEPAVDSLDETPVVDNFTRRLRGGSWQTPSSRIRSAYRNNSVPTNRLTNLGFRPARTYVATKTQLRGGKNALKANGLEEADYRQAVELNSNNATAYNNLGSFLCDVKHDYDGAIAAFQKSVELAPNYAIAHYNLGNALCNQCKLRAAIASYQKAIELDPEDARNAEVHCNLGLALQDVGKLPEALKELRRGHELGSKRPEWRYPSGEWVQECERLIALEQR